MFKTKDWTTIWILLVLSMLCFKVASTDATADKVKRNRTRIHGIVNKAPQQAITTIFKSIRDTSVVGVTSASATLIVQELKGNILALGNFKVESGNNLDKSITDYMDANSNITGASTINAIKTAIAPTVTPTSTATITVTPTPTP